MDAGLAAVCGALAGAVGAIGAAWATSRTQWKSARLSARAAHQAQRREERTSRYKEFASAVKEASIELTITIPEGSDYVDYFTDDYIALVEPLVKGVVDSFPNVALAGPKEVRKAAREAMDHVGATMIAALELNECYRRAPEDRPMREDTLQSFTSFKRSNRLVYETWTAFIELAGETLDDDGVISLQ